MDDAIEILQMRENGKKVKKQFKLFKSKSK